MRELLTIQDLSTGYRLKKGSKRVLHQNLTASVGRGEFIAILGPNGAGKSTLLKTLLGYIPSLAGEIWYNNRLLSDITVKELATKVSVVLTDRIDDIYLTAQEVVWSARYPYSSFWRKPSERDRKLVDEAVERTGIENFLSRKLHALSDGERQRVMIARALAQDTPLIFLDEPTAFIDSPGRVELMQLLKSIAGKDKSFLMTIHDVELALHFADTLWLLGSDGSFEKGKPEELVNKGSINRLFDRGTVKFDPQSKTFH
jgi:iron complex transport system ATP-binding protein